MSPLLWYLLGVATALFAVSPAIIVLGRRPEKIIYIPPRVDREVLQ